MRILVLAIVLIGLLGGGGFFAYHYYGGFGAERGPAVAFVDAYGNYNEVASEVETLVHAPSAGENADRAALLSLLNSILVDDLEPQGRDSLAREAFAKLDAIKQDVDAAQSAQARLYSTLTDLENAVGTFHGVRLRDSATHIVGLARARTETAAHITSVLAETNEQTYSIITRILADGGQLTNEHTQAINDATSGAQTRHDELAGLYSDLMVQRESLDQAFQQFVAVAI